MVAHKKLPFAITSLLTNDIIDVLLMFYTMDTDGDIHIGNVYMNGKNYSIVVSLIPEDDDEDDEEDEGGEEAYDNAPDLNSDFSLFLLQWGVRLDIGEKSVPKFSAGRRIKAKANYRNGFVVRKLFGRCEGSNRENA